MVKAEVPAEAVESIPEDGKAKIELPIKVDDFEISTEESLKEELDINTYRVVLADYDSDDFDINVEFGLQDEEENDVADQEWLLKPGQTKGDLVVYLSYECAYTSIYVHDERPATADEIKTISGFDTVPGITDWENYGSIDESLKEAKKDEEEPTDPDQAKLDAKKVDNQLIISKKGEMDNTDSDKISVELAADEFEALKKGFKGSVEGYDIDTMVEALNEADEDEVECQLCHEMLNKADAEKIDGIGYVCEACKEAICDKGLDEDAHAQYAKPEGDRVAAYNNALKYAKKENKPFIYGYTNRAGKFFAAETPMKVTGSPADAEKEFRSRYKNCDTVYVAYPEKGFVDENLEEGKKADESPVDPEAAKLEVHTMLNDLVADEIEAINGYDDAKAKIMDTPIEHKESILDTIDHIKGEEQEHIVVKIAATTEIPFDKEEESHDLAAEEEAPAEEALGR